MDHKDCHFKFQKWSGCTKVVRGQSRDHLILHHLCFTIEFIIIVCFEHAYLWCSILAISLAIYYFSIAVWLRNWPQKAKHTLLVTSGSKFILRGYWPQWSHNLWLLRPIASSLNFWCMLGVSVEVLTKNILLVHWMFFLNHFTKLHN